MRRVSLVARTTLRTCRAHYPGGSKRVHVSIASPSHTAFPFLWEGRHPHCPFRGLLRLHSRYGPYACSTAQGGLCHGASTGPVTQPRRPSATSAIDNSLGGTLLHKCFAPSRRTRGSRPRLNDLHTSTVSELAWPLTLRQPTPSGTGGVRVEWAKPAPTAELVRYRPSTTRRHGPLSTVSTCNNLIVTVPESCR